MLEEEAELQLSAATEVSRSASTVFDRAIDLKGIFICKFEREQMI